MPTAVSPPPPPPAAGRPRLCGEWAPPPVLWQSWYHLFVRRWLGAGERLLLVFSDGLFSQPELMMAAVAKHLRAPRWWRARLMPAPPPALGKATHGPAVALGHARARPARGAFTCSILTSRQACRRTRSTRSWRTTRATSAGCAGGAARARCGARRRSVARRRRSRRLPSRATTRAATRGPSGCCAGSWRRRCAVSTRCCEGQSGRACPASGCRAAARLGSDGGVGPGRLARGAGARWRGAARGLVVLCGLSTFYVWGLGPVYASHASTRHTRQHTTQHTHGRAVHTPHRHPQVRLAHSSLIPRSCERNDALLGLTLACMHVVSPSWRLVLSF